ncbi:MAG: thiamine pyrophosphate-dependent enzyme [Armatimonadota bacterium]|nr:thiamine pyrophosphate-dependent enzyme [Armatimonadota bacterium]
MPSLKQLSHREVRLTGGHRLCPGCGEPIVARQILMSTEHPVLATNATGCLEVSTTIFPYTAWNIPWLHIAFENAAAAASGLEAMYQSLKAQGKLDPDANYKFVAFGGDGGTYDIGLQSLSGAVERGHDFLYVCLNNEAYMNTGVQRSSATLKGAHTTTSPAGEVIPGKQQNRKDLTEIMVAHDIPYAAQTIPGRWNDITRKAEKAFEIEGPAFINVLTPCPLGWGHDGALTPEISQLAADTCVWPLYEVEYGEYNITYTPREKQPIEAFLEPQARFGHLFKSDQGEQVRKAVQEWVDWKWEALLKKAGEA